MLLGVFSYFPLKTTRNSSGKVLSLWRRFHVNLFVYVIYITSHHKANALMNIGGIFFARIFSRKHGILTLEDRNLNFRLLIEEMKGIYSKHFLKFITYSIHLTKAQKYMDWNVLKSKLKTKNLDVIRYNNENLAYKLTQH